MRIPAEVIYTYLKNVAKLHLFGNRNLETIIPHFYITNKCNLNCSYCDDGTGKKYNIQKIKEAGTEETKELLKIIRKKYSWISITGGEPLVRDDIIELLKFAKELKFKMIVLNTNGFLLDKKLEILNYIDQLVISLDTPDIEQFSKIIGRPLFYAKKIKENIIFCSKKKSLTINSVIMSDKIINARDVMHFCFEHDIIFSPMPQIIKKVPHPGLKDNEEYKKFIREIIAYKKQGKKIFGTMQSLNKIINFERYECYPTLIMDVYCNGDLHYPCSPLNIIAGNLLEEGSWDRVIEKARKKFGPIQRCPHSCHVSCYMEPSLLVQHPLSIFSEISYF